ncbi:MAG TPA: hypothetical protein PKW29_13900 [Clostridia bacterium]|nr:hypothetical protein [Clostridia bacterium]
MINGITFDLRNVRARDDARVREKMFADGILAGCGMTYSGKGLTVGTGALIFKGRVMSIDSPETIMSATTEANGYGRLRLVIDLSAEPNEVEFTQARWEWDYQAANSDWPALTQDDINDGTHEEYEAVMCIVSFASSNISGVVSSLPEVRAGLLVTGLSLPTSGWSGSGPYTKTFTVTGASTDTARRYLLMPDWSSTAATRALEKTAWNLIDDYEITAADTLTLTVTAVPATAVSFSLKEVV